VTPPQLGSSARSSAIPYSDADISAT
jgi:hypothetical protein